MLQSRFIKPNATSPYCRQTSNNDKLSRKIDEFNDKPVLTLGQQSTVQYSTRPIPFEHAEEVVEKMNYTTSLHEVATKISVGEMVNVIAYIDLNNAEPLTVNTQYGVKKNLEAITYDDSFCDHIKLTLWNTHVNSISESGVYKPQYLKVNSFNGKYLTTATASVIKQSKTDIKVKDIQTTSTFENVIFPPDTLNLFEQSHFIKKCKRRAQVIGVFVTCTNCSSKSLTKNSESIFLVKATFMKEDEGKVMLTMPHEILVKFCKKLGITIDDDDEIQIQLLTTSNIKANVSDVSL